MGQLIFMDIVTITDVAAKAAAGQIKRPTMIRNPPIFAIMATQTVFEGKRFAPVKRRQIFFATSRQIFRMHSFEPAIALLLRQGATGEGEPGGVEPVALGIRAGPPDQRRSVLQQLQVKIARGNKGGLRLLALGDVDDKYRDSHHRAAVAKNRAVTILVKCPQAR